MLQFAVEGAFACFEPESRSDGMAVTVAENPFESRQRLSNTGDEALVNSSFTGGTRLNRHRQRESQSASLRQAEGSAGRAKR